jgi:hypothetical protein
VTGTQLEASIRGDVDDVRGEPDWTQAIVGIPAPKAKSRPEQTFSSSVTSRATGDPFLSSTNVTF